MKSGLLPGIVILSFVFSTPTLVMADGVVSELEDTKLILELNETDQDAEIVLTVESDDGVRWLSIFDPGGFKVLRLRSGDRGRIGLSEILIETAEPDVTNVLNAYPKGMYTVFVRTVSGSWLLSRVKLSHSRLPAPSFSPSAGEFVDSAQDLIVTWNPVADAEAYILEVEQDELHVNITTRLEPGETRFTIPAAFLIPGTEYEIAMTTEAHNGNLSVAEGTFETLE